MSQWFVYILACADGTYYTGITTDLVRRVREHNGELAARGAKYTSARRPVQLVYSESTLNRSTAQMREHKIRTLSKENKALLWKASYKQ